MKEILGPDQEKERRTFFAVSLYADVVLGALKLPGPEYKILRALLGYVNFDTGKCIPSPSKALLQAETNIDRTTMTKALAKLKARGLIDFKRQGKALHFHHLYWFPWWHSEELQQFAQRLRSKEISVRDLVTAGADPALNSNILSKAKRADPHGPLFEQQRTVQRSASPDDPALNSKTLPCFEQYVTVQEPLEPYEEKSGDNKDRSSVSHEQNASLSGEQPTPPLSEKKKSEVTDERLREIECMGIKVPLSLKKKPSKAKEK